MIRIRRSVTEAGRRQAFINRYGETYSRPDLPPNWMLFEILHFGDVSRIYSALPGPRRNEIAACFSLRHKVLASWLHTTSSLRNFCAHHARLWNRVFGVRPKTPRTGGARRACFEDSRRFYAQAVMIKMLLDKTAGGEFWAAGLKDLFTRFPDVPKRDMGFPEGWEALSLWSGERK